MKSSALIHGVLGALLVACGSDITIADGGSGGDGGDGGAGGSSSSLDTSSNGAGSATGGSTSSSQSSSQSSTSATTSNAGGGPGSTTAGPGPQSSSQSSNQSSVTSGQPTCPGNGDDCSECASLACPAEWCECAANASCPPLVACWDACTTDACFQACMQAHQPGISDAVSVQSCASSQCGGCQQGWEPLDPCSECMFQDCDEAMNACLAEPACSALWACLGDCPQLGLTCQQACYDEFGEGTGALQGLLECTQDECPTCQ